jgi:hypothetical protein
VACPSNSTFCADFESGGMPTGSTYNTTDGTTWATAFTLDSTTFHAGGHSLQVKPSNVGFSPHMLDVPIPGKTFWVRLYVRSDHDIGDSAAIHNAFIAATESANGDPNNRGTMQVAEQYCQVLLNFNDNLMLSNGGTAACSAGGKVVTKNAWHCMEAFFDGTNGDVRVFSDGVEVITTLAWSMAKLNYASFEFGFWEYSGPSRTMWYDDVVVAPTRINCL